MQRWFSRVSKKYHGKRQNIVRRDGKDMIEDFCHNVVPVVVGEVLSAEGAIQRDTFERAKRSYFFGMWMRNIVFLCLGVATGWYLA